MKKMMLFITILFLSTTVFADESKATHIGKWRIASEWAGWFSPECRDMEIEFTTDGKVIRTSGDLVYTTEVAYTPKEHRIRLDEVFLSHNSKPACSGKPAEDLMKHLKKNSYITIANDRLLYYRNKDKNSLIIFSRI